MDYSAGNSYLLEEFLFFRFRNTNSRKNSLESLFFDSILILLICVPLITRSSHRLLFNLLPLLFMCISAFFLFLLHIFTGFLLRRFLQIVFVDFKSKHLFETLKSLLLNSVHVFLILALGSLLTLYLFTFVASFFGYMTVISWSISVYYELSYCFS